MNNKQVKTIFTEGNSMVKTITALDALWHVVSRLCSSIEHLHTFVMENASDRTQKRVILKQINLICKGTKYLANEMEYVKPQSSLT